MATKARTTSTTEQYDWGLLAIVITLLALGLVMVFSASFARGLDGYQNPYYYISRQLVWCGIGLAVMIVAARIPYTFWERWSIALMGGALLALIAVMIFGGERYGATRQFFGGSIQPSEPAKIIIIMYVSAWLSSKGAKIRDVRVGLLPFSVLMGAVAVLFFLQPAISTAILTVLTASIMFFVAGAELKQLLAVGGGAAATFWFVINYSSYASGRMTRYLDSFWNPLFSEEWQVQQSVEAFMRGGPLGMGVGNGLAKRPDFLPVSWSDNIFAVIGEELGLIGALLVIVLFTLLAYRGLRTALRAQDNFGMLLATGITSLLILQTILNIAVVTSVTPPTGVTLPFMSYGGSSLVTALGAVGILLSISKHREGGQSSPLGKMTYARFDFGWRNRRSRLSGASRRRSTAQRPARQPVRGERSR